MLVEIPLQFMSYMKHMRIKARNPRINWTKLARQAHSLGHKHDDDD